MSFQYDDYLKGHISAVQKAADWIVLHCQDMIPKIDEYNLRCHISMHDDSKLSPVEYDAYDAYFYGDNSDNKFKYAWLRHIHCNPHHWQYWILVNDDGSEEILEMPLEYVIEMIADWWSFSFRSGNLREIFDWYDKHKEMKLHPKTRKVIEDILARIKAELDKEEAIQGRL